MPLEEAARTGGRATVEDLQRSSSMPLEDYSGGQGKNMGELGAPWARLPRLLSRVLAGPCRGQFLSGVALEAWLYNKGCRVTTFI